MSYKVIVWKANGEVNKYPFESGATIQQILSILNSKELAIIGAVDNRLTDRLSLIFILIGQLKLEANL